MAELTPELKKVLQEAGMGGDACWKHKQSGKWIVYHWACERLADHADIEFTEPTILECNAANSVALLIKGTTKDGKTAWSIGEASPQNNKNPYPYAMAEKRAKDRVILKLVGLHGLAYSEEEADDFKARNPDVMEQNRQKADDAAAHQVGKYLDKQKPDVSDLPRNEQEWDEWIATFKGIVDGCSDNAAIDACMKGAKKRVEALQKVNKAKFDDLRDHVQGRREILNTPTDNTMIGAG